MARLPADAQLLALALLNYADDEGYFLAEASVIRSACLPFREDSGSLPVLVQTLIKSEWIEVTWSETHGPVGRVVSFVNHQVVNKPRKSKLKQYWGIPYIYGTNPVKLPDDSRNPTVRNGMDQGKDQGKEQGMEGARIELENQGEEMARPKNIITQTGFNLSPLMESPKVSEAWNGFLDTRKTMKRPATEYAQKLLIKKLETLSGNNEAKAVEILEQSIVKCWQDLFPVRSPGFGKSFGPGPGGDMEDDLLVTGSGE